MTAKANTGRQQVWKAGQRAMTMIAETIKAPSLHLLCFCLFPAHAVFVGARHVKWRSSTTHLSPFPVDTIYCGAVSILQQQFDRVFRAAEIPRRLCRYIDMLTRHPASFAVPAIVLPS